MPRRRGLLTEEELLLRTQSAPPPLPTPGPYTPDQPVAPDMIDYGGYSSRWQGGPIEPPPDRYMRPAPGRFEQLPFVDEMEMLRGRIERLRGELGEPTFYSQQRPERLPVSPVSMAPQQAPGSSAATVAPWSPAAVSGVPGRRRRRGVFGRPIELAEVRSLWT